MIWVSAAVDVDMDEFTTDELLSVLIDREVDLIKKTELLRLYETKMYHPEKFDEVFKEFCWSVLGKSL